MFDPDYRDRVFQSILTLLEEEDWSLKQVPLERTSEKLSQLEPRSALVCACSGTAAHSCRHSK